MEIVNQDLVKVHSSPSQTWLNIRRPQRMVGERARGHCSTATCKTGSGMESADPGGWTLDHQNTRFAHARSLTHSLTPSLTPSLTRSLPHSLTHSLTLSLSLSHHHHHHHDLHLHHHHHLSAPSRLSAATLLDLTHTVWGLLPA